MVEVQLAKVELGFQGFIQPRDIYQASDESFNFFILPSACASIEQTPQRPVAVSRDLDAFLLGKSYNDVIEYNIPAGLTTSHLLGINCFPARTYPPSLVTRVIPCLGRLFIVGEMLDESFTLEKARALKEIESYKKTLYQRVSDLDPHEFIHFLSEFEKELGLLPKRDEKRGFLLEEFFVLKKIREEKQYGAR